MTSRAHSQECQGPKIATQIYVTEILQRLPATIIAAQVTLMAPQDLKQRHATHLSFQTEKLNKAVNKNVIFPSDLVRSHS